MKPTPITPEEIDTLKDALGMVRLHKNTGPKFNAIFDKLAGLVEFPAYALIGPGTLPGEVAPWLADGECSDCGCPVSELPREGCTSAGCPIMRTLTQPAPEIQPYGERVGRPAFVVQYSNDPARKRFFDQPNASFEQVGPAASKARAFANQMPGTNWRVVERWTMERETAIIPATGPASDATPPPQDKATQDREALRELLGRAEKRLRGGLWTDALWEFLSVADAIGQTAIRADAKTALLDGRVFELAKMLESRGIVRAESDKSERVPCAACDRGDFTIWHADDCPRKGYSALGGPANEPEGRALLVVCDKALRQWQDGKADDAFRLVLGILEQIGLSALATKKLAHETDAKRDALQGEVNGLSNLIGAMNNGGI